MRNRVEHYVIYPNKSLGDWEYEYSSNVGKKSIRTLKVTNVTSYVQDGTGRISTEETIAQQVAAIGNANASLSQDIANIREMLSSHVNDSNIHVSPEDRQNWNNAHDNRISLSVEDGRLIIS